MGEKEVRFLTGAELRTTAGGKLTGYACVYGQLSEDLGNFREMILGGAFADCLGSDPDVRALWNHNPAAVLGRTRANTLRLSEDALGLRFELDLPDTQVGRDARVSIERRDVSQCSFGLASGSSREKTGG